MTPRWHVRLAAAVGLLAIVALVPPGARAVEVDWGQPGATAEYGESIEFRQAVTIGAEAERVEILLEFPGAPGPLVVEAEPGTAGRRTLRHTIDLADGHLLPNTTITARWRVVGRDGTEAVGPPITIRYEDTRFDWKTAAGDVVRVHWYEGSDAFGRRALEIGDRAVRETAALLGVTEDEPVDFFVYADQREFYEALGPGTRENVGGQANADLRTLFALITPGEIDDQWVSIVIPHELVHLVFDTAVDNPYHFPPRWLNEGIAVYLSQGYELGDRSTVEQASRDGSLIPLEGLTGQFPTTRDRFFLAYAESVAAVDFFIRTHGRDALVELVRSYATGLTDDEAFEQAIGMDVAAFDAAWRDDLGAGDPTEHGPQPAPAGPLPPGWSPPAGPVPATPAPNIPRDTPTPAAPPDGAAGQGLDARFVGLAAAGLVAAVAVALALIRRRPRPVAAPADAVSASASAPPPTPWAPGAGDDAARTGDAADDPESARGDPR